VHEVLDILWIPITKAIRSKFISSFLCLLQIDKEEFEHPLIFSCNLNVAIFWFFTLFFQVDA